MGPWARLLHFVTLPGDSHTEVLSKALLLVLLILLTAASAITLAKFSAGSFSFRYVSDMALAVHTLCVYALLGWLLVTRRFPRRLLAGALVMYSVFVLWADLELVIEGGHRAWPIIVLFVDMILLLELPDALTWMFACEMMIWVPLVAFEREYSYGLRGLVSTSDRYCNCETPPCPQGIYREFSHIGFVMLIFLADMVMTRRFARGMREERRRMATTVEHAGRIAGALARFDTDLASSALAESSDMPDEMVESFNKLVGNLRSFRKYLPDSCLMGVGVSYDDTTASPTDSESCSTYTSEILFSPTLHVKNVSILAVESKGYWAVAKGGNLVTFVEDWVSLVVPVVHNCLGVIDDFNGDRIVAAFNGSRICLSHAQASLRCAARLRRNGDCCVGVATDRAMCGDLGSNDLRRYSIVGDVVGCAGLVSRLASAWGKDALAHARTVRGAIGEVQVMLQQEQVVFPGDDTPTRLYEVIAEATCSRHEEWMYQLQTMTDTDPYTLYNMALAKGQDGHFAESVKMLQDSDLPHAVRLRTVLQDAPHLPVFQVSEFALTERSTVGDHPL